jgi:hypothetical protein
VAKLLPTPPTCCGLALALPTDLVDIQKALTGGAYADYVGRGSLWGNASELWTNSFGVVAKAARALAGEASDLGVQVRENATLSDLADLFERHSVVTVVAHWRGPQISKLDIVKEPAAIICRLAEEASDLAFRLRAGFVPDWRKRLDDLQTESACRSRLAELLNERMLRTPPLATPPRGTEWHMDQITLRHQNRAALDTWWPEAFKAGNRLELADGLHAAEAISAVVPERWRGIADLSNCQSAQMIDKIKQFRCDRLVIANERETNPLSRITLLRVVYNLLLHNKVNYVDARSELAARMRRETSVLKGRLS